MMIFPALPRRTRVAPHSGRLAAAAPAVSGSGPFGRRMASCLQHEMPAQQKWLQSLLCFFQRKAQGLLRICRSHRFQTGSWGSLWISSMRRQQLCDFSEMDMLCPSGLVQLAAYSRADGRDRLPADAGICLPRLPGERDSGIFHLATAKDEKVGLTRDTPWMTIVKKFNDHHLLKNPGWKHVPQRRQERNSYSLTEKKFDSLLRDRANL